MHKKPSITSRWVVIDPMTYIGDRVFDYIRAPFPGGYYVTRDLALQLPEQLVTTPHIDANMSLLSDTLTLRPGFRFDGASGPAVDGVHNMLGAMIHDALYAAIKGGAEGLSAWKADRIYRQVCIAQGAGKTRAWAHWLALRTCGWLWRL